MKWLLVAGCWTVLALVFASQSYVYSAVSDEEKDWDRIFLWTLTDWYLWAALSPFILWLAHRYRFERGTWRQALFVHLPASVLFALLHLALQAVVQCFTGWAHIGRAPVWTAFLYFFAKKISPGFPDVLGHSRRQPQRALLPALPPTRGAGAQARSRTRPLAVADIADATAPALSF